MTEWPENLSQQAGTLGAAYRKKYAIAQLLLNVKYRAILRQLPVFAWRWFAIAIRPDR